MIEEPVENLAEMTIQLDYSSVQQSFASLGGLSVLGSFEVVFVRSIGCAEPYFAALDVALLHLDFAFPLVASKSFAEDLVNTGPSSAEDHMVPYHEQEWRLRSETLAFVALSLLLAVQQNLSSKKSAVFGPAGPYPDDAASPSFADADVAYAVAARAVVAVGTDTAGLDSDSDYLRSSYYAEVLVVAADSSLKYVQGAESVAGE